MLQLSSSHQFHGQGKIPPAEVQLRLLVLGITPQLQQTKLAMP